MEIKALALFAVAYSLKSMSLEVDFSCLKNDSNNVMFYIYLAYYTYAYIILFYIWSKYSFPVITPAIKLIIFVCFTN